MLIGRVAKDGTAYLPLTVLGESNLSLEAVVDTGFDDFLMLPRTLKKRARLRPAAYYPFELADGSEVRLRVYLGKVRFDGRTLTIPILLTRSPEALLGAAMFQGRRLTVRYRRRLVRLEEDR